MVKFFLLLLQELIYYFAVIIKGIRDSNANFIVNTAAISCILPPVNISGITTVSAAISLDGVMWSNSFSFTYYRKC